jgi:transcriptional activator for dhaKLM operon
VRQLFAVLEAAAIHADFGRIEAQHLPAELRSAAGDRASGDAGRALKDSRYRVSTDEDTERAAIEAALSQTDGALGRTAELLGMGRTTLWRKLRAYGLTAGEQGADALE